MVRQCVILLGGLGTRLGELTREMPKPLLEVAGGPFVDVLVREACRRGFTDILLLAGHAAPVVEELRGTARRASLAGRRVDSASSWKASRSAQAEPSATPWTSFTTASCS
jgi:NDP-sugar pyrophosphorylase family protein